MISEQINYFKEEGYNVKMISLLGLSSLTSYCYELQAKLRVRKRNTRKELASEAARWRLNLLQVLINDCLSRLDVFFKYKIRQILKDMQPDSTIIYHYPYSAAHFISNSKINRLKFVLCEHNIEWRFFEERIEKNALNRFLLHIAKKIELEYIKKVDAVIFVSEQDRVTILEEVGVGNISTIVWIPSAKGRISIMAKNPDYSIIKKITGKTVIGFVGTNFGPNIVAVKSIIQLAKSVDDSIVFLIIGSVNKSFDSEADLPQNIIFTGYVQDLDYYLSLCDLFINPKTSSDTGIEVKMFDYLKFDKKIISTEIGARGFEDFDNVVITSIDQMPILLRELMENRNVNRHI